MNKGIFEAALQSGEGLRAEFKERFSNKIDRDMVAFANTCGGQIFLGVDDKGQILGEKLTNELKAKINDLARNCEPSISIEKIEQIEATVVVTIKESVVKPHSCSSGHFRRLDGATQKMNQTELRVLFKEADKGPRFEQQINDRVSWEDISQEKIKYFLIESKVKIEDLNPKNILNSLDLSQGDDINNAGVLLFSDEPRRFINQCELILVAFKGTDGVNIYDRMYVQSDLLAQFNEAMTFIQKHLNTRIEIKGANREDICEIPLEAIREAIINAIIHRDYSVSGTSIMVEVHEDRVEIKNPGGLPDGVNVDSISMRSIRRNPIIADIFARMEKAERMASGVKRIMKLVQDSGLPKPKIEGDRLFFTISFQRDPKYSSPKEEHGSTVSDFGTQSAPSRHPVGAQLELNEENIQLLEFCEVSRSFSELIELIGWSDRTKFRRKVVTPVLDAGLIRRTIPDKPNSSKQRYVLTEQGVELLRSSKE